MNQNDLITREQWWIDNSESFYNISPTAQNSLGIKRSEEFKEKVRKANLGLKHPEWRRKIKSEVMRGANHWTAKQKVSEEAKANMKIAQKIIHSRPDYICTSNKTVQQFTKDGIFIAEYISATKAGKAIGRTQAAVSHACRGDVKTCKGFVWKYK